jgi:uncharacterized membrane protein
VGDILDQAATPARLAKLAAAGVLAGEGGARAGRMASSSPPAAEWRKVLGGVLLVLGALLVAAGVVFFFAYNWAKLPAFAKLGIVAAGITASVATARVRTLERASGTIALVVAALLVGPLLVVYGQRYQTGADPYELFLTWTLLVLPWIAIARSSLLWAVGVVLADTTISLYCAELGTDGLTSLPFVAALHVALVAGLEVVFTRTAGWLKNRLLLRCLVLGGVGAVTLGACAWVVDHQPSAALITCAVATPVTWVGIFSFYERRQRDIAMLAIAGASAVCVTSTVFGKWLFDSWHDAAPLFALGFFVILEVGALARWLRWEMHRRPEAP